MHKSVEDQISQYRGRKVLVDTNILLLYFAGRLNKSIIESFKRIKQFTIEDYDLLDALLSMMGPIVTTPNILTEVSNLAGSLYGNTREEFFQEFRNHVLILEERHVSSVEVVGTSMFVKLGLTDAAIALAGQDVVVISMDFQLVGALQRQGIAAINFNNLRFIA